MVLSRAGAWSGEVSESDGATAQAVAGPKDFGPLGVCTHIGVGARRDRFSTIEKRRCDCAGGRAQAASVSAMAHRRSWFADFRDSVNSHFNLHPLLALTNATLISAH